MLKEVIPLDQCDIDGCNNIAEFTDDRIEMPVIKWDEKHGYWQKQGKRDLRLCRECVIDYLNFNLWGKDE